MQNPFRYFNSSPEVIRLAVMMYVRFPLSLRQVEDLLSERGIDVCHETVRFWWNRFGPLFAGEIRRRRVDRRNWSNWRWHLDEGECQKICARAVLSDIDEPFAEDDGELCFGLVPFPRRTFPRLGRMIENEI